MKTPIIITALNLVLVTGAFAQKLPSVQTATGLRAPTNIKIDGKATEWNNQFQAHNHATEIYYTVANDDQYLYLIIQEDVPNLINKIFGGGITLTLQSSGKKDNKNGISITYPITDKPYGISFTLVDRKGNIPDTSHSTADSIMAANNQTIQNECKWIKVGGINGMDTLSVYNQEGILAAGRFNNKKVYTCEIAIPLKYLLAANINSKFSYHIRLNGRPSNDGGSFSIGGNGTTANAAVVASFMASMNKVQGELFAPTDFWGEYTLAKTK